METLTKTASEKPSCGDLTTGQGDNSTFAAAFRQLMWRKLEQPCPEAEEVSEEIDELAERIKKHLPADQKTLIRRLKDAWCKQMGLYQEKAYKDGFADAREFSSMIAAWK